MSVGDQFLTKKEFDLFVKNLNYRLSGLSIIAVPIDEPTSPLDEFIDLIDTPATYTGKAKYVVKVNSGASALIFKKFEYDADLLCYIIEE